MKTITQALDQLAEIAKLAENTHLPNWPSWEYRAENMPEIEKSTRKLPGNAPRAEQQLGLSSTLSDLLPFSLSDLRKLPRKAFLGPAVGILVCFAVLSYYDSIGDPVRFATALASFAAFASCYLLYRLCGHRKPWSWLCLVGLSVVFTVRLFLPLLPWVYQFMPAIPTDPVVGLAEGVTGRFCRYFVTAGLFEELWKGAPVLLMYGLTHRLKSSSRPKFGVCEPLDGILLGVAAATGFALAENLFSYGPFSVWPGPPSADRPLSDLMLMIIRSLDLVFCHLAWTGLFGYFIGMAALHPHSRFKLLATGYLAAATFHGLWDATSGFDSLSQLLVGLLSYCALALAILKGRKVSPDRANNFATSARRNNAPRVAGSVRLEPALLIAGKPFPIRVGQRLFAQDVPGLQPGAADGLVGEFTASPDNPARIGLTNRSATPWIKITAAGERRTVEPGKTVHLVAGATIRFTGDLPLGCEGRLQ